MDNLLTKVVISKRYRRVTLHRFLLSKLVWEPEEFLFTHLLALYENQVFLDTLAARDPKFSEAFSSELDSVRESLVELRAFNNAGLSRMSEVLRKRFDGGEARFIYPQRNLLEQEKRYKSFVQFRLQTPLGQDVKRLQPSTRIGKGYTDKGTAKNTAKDGTQRWQDVAGKEIKGEIPERSTRTGFKK